MADIKALMRSIRKTTKSSSFDNSKYGEIQGWISTGDYGLNRIISGSIYKGVPEGKVILMAGESQCTPRDQKVRILTKIDLDSDNIDDDV